MDMSNEIDQNLGAVVDACKPALVRHGLSFSQLFEPSPPETVSVTTILMHSSGQWIRGCCTLPLAKQDPQGYASGSTYARRYSLMALVGCCPDDDDGNAASGHGRGYGGHQEPPRPPHAPRSAPPAAPPPQAFRPPAPAAPESRGDAQASDGRPVDKESQERAVLRADCKRLYVALGGNPDDAKAMHSDFALILGGVIPGNWDMDLARWCRLRNALDQWKREEKQLPSQKPQGTLTEAGAGPSDPARFAQ